jgi:hypothetical protein
VVCPYHGWAFDGTGSLQDVPVSPHCMLNPLLLLAALTAMVESHVPLAVAALRPNRRSTRALPVELQSETGPGELPKRPIVPAYPGGYLPLQTLLSHSGVLVCLASLWLLSFKVTLLPACPCLQWRRRAASSGCFTAPRTCPWRSGHPSHTCRSWVSGRQSSVVFVLGPASEGAMHAQPGQPNTASTAHTQHISG